ncbi:MAG: SRPBCC family protein [Gordonia sp. (in: high G+C Gram-positive bacteria)]
MTLNPADDVARVVSAERLVAAPAAAIFDLIADPAAQPRWDGNDNLDSSADGQRVRNVGDVFVTRLTNGADRENRIVEFDEGRLIAWLPSPVGEQPPGHLWRWELFDGDDASTVRVVHTYDWTNLHDPARQERARATTSESLAKSVDRLAALAESGATAR